MDTLRASIQFRELDGEPLRVKGAVVSYTELRHPSEVLAYAVEFNGRKVVMATDREPDPEGARGKEQMGRNLIRLARDADLLIHDGQYTDEEYYNSRVGWGHSPVGEAIRVARESGAKRLAIFHHDPMSSDEKLAKLERELQKQIEEREDFELFFAVEGSEFML